MRPKADTGMLSAALILALARQSIHRLGKPPNALLDSLQPLFLVLRDPLQSLVLVLRLTS